ncbi:MAG: hypothetical protein Q7R88_02140 [bacterium]|nr:hypothetical protein [bacterium]
MTKADTSIPRNPHGLPQTITLAQLEQGDLEAPHAEHTRAGKLVEPVDESPDLDPVREVLLRVIFALGGIILFLVLGILVRALTYLLSADEFIPIIILLALGAFSVLVFKRRQQEIGDGDALKLSEDVRKLQIFLQIIPIGCLTASLLSIFIARSPFAFNLSLGAALLARTVNHEIFQYILARRSRTDGKSPQTKKERYLRIFLSFITANFLLLFALLLLRSMHR